MRIIKIMDKRDYLESWPRIERNAVRAIIIKDDKIAMVKSNKEGFYKFPGGGIERFEEHIEALIRETQEETGLIIKENTIREYGFFVECRKSLNEDTIFEQKSYYYQAEVEDKITLTNLDDYEKELEYGLEWVDINHALKVNKAFTNTAEFTYVVRETQVLMELASHEQPKRVYLSY